jgi:hypothetical protein
MLYFQPGPYFDQRFNLRQANVPMQYTNNQYNTPVVGNSFGGSNTVGYRPAIPMYHAGGTTIDFLTGQLYKPIGVVGGPTNSDGAYASMGTGQEIYTVQPDYITPNAYLNTARGLPFDVNALNANGYLAAGLGSDRNAMPNFGKSPKSKHNFSKPLNNVLYTSNSYASDGPMYQKSPMYMKRPDINDEGAYASFGKGRKEKEKSAKKTIGRIPEILKTKIHGTTVTLTKNGKVIVT